MTASPPKPAFLGSRRWLARLALLVVGFLIGVAIVEVALRIAGLPHFYHRHSRPEQWRIPIRDEDPLVFYNQPSTNIRFVYDGNPRGYFDKGDGVDQITNSLGFRGPEFSVTKPPHTVRIAFLGDSFTFGDGVRFEDTYPQVAAKVLTQAAPAGGSNYEALDFGVGSFNTAQEVSLFEHDVLAKGFAPDVVVLGYVLNDAEPTLWYFDKDSRTIKRHEQPALEGLDQPKPPATLLYRSRLAQLIWQFVTGRRRTAQTIAYYQAINQPTNPGLRDSYHWLHRLVDDCRDRHIACYVVLFPILIDLNDSYPFNDAHAQMRHELEGSGAVFIDLLPLLKGMNAARLWVHPTDQHPNEIVHRIAGDAVAKAIEAHGLPTTQR